LVLRLETEDFALYLESREHIVVAEYKRQLYTGSDKIYERAQRKR